MLITKIGGRQETFPWGSPFHYGRSWDVFVEAKVCRSFSKQHFSRFRQKAYPRSADPFQQNTDPPLKSPKMLTWICATTGLCILRLAKWTEGGNTQLKLPTTRTKELMCGTYLQAPETHLGLADDRLVTLGMMLAQSLHTNSCSTCPGIFYHLWGTDFAVNIFHSVL